MPATETFGIEVEIAPKVADGARKVDDALAGLEKHAKSTGESMAQAIGGGMVDGAAKAAKGVDGLAGAFRALENSLMPVIKAERDYAAAELLASEAVKAGIATEKQATAVLVEKAKAMASIVNETDDYGSSIASAGASAASTASKTMGLIDGIGKVGLAMNTATLAINIGKSALNAFSSAADIAGKAYDRLHVGTPGSYERDNENVIGNQRQRVAALGMSVGDLPGLDGISSAPEFARAKLEHDAMLENADAINAWLDKKEAMRAGQAKSLADSKQMFQYMKEADQAQNDEIAKAEAEWKRHDEEMRRLVQTGQEAIEEWDPITKKWKTIQEGITPMGSSKSAPSPMAAPSGWDEFAADIATAGDNFQTLADAATEFARATASAGPEYWDALGQALSEIEIARGKASYTGKDGNVYGANLKAQAEDANDLAVALKGPLSNALDDVIGQIATMTFDLKSLFRSLAEEIARALIQMLLLQAIKASFSSTSGGLGGFLWDLAGGKEGGASARYAPGDSFGGGASNAGGGAVFREPVQKRTGGDGGGGGGGGAVYNKIVVVADMRAAALEALKSKEGEQATIVHVANNKGKLGAAR